MNTRVSLYLDLLRFGAAMMVMFYHVALSRISGGVWQWYRDSHIGSDVVILFFILSGYVIAYVVDAKKENKTDYMVNRLSRLYSVIVPVLLLTMVVDTIGIYLSPDFYIPWINSYAVYDNVTSFFANLFFVNQIWTFHIRPSTNGPFWSLSYEFWYYMMFFAVCYFTGKKRVLLALLILLIMGPKLWVLAPTWWLGVWTYRKSQTINHSQVTGWLLFLSPIAIYAAIKYFGIDADLLIWTKEVLGKETVSTWLRYSDEFMISFVYAVLVSMHFLGLVTVAKKNLFWLERFKKPIRFWAGLTFSLYLFHSPLMNFFASVLPGEITSVSRHLAIVVCIMLVTVVLGSLTEKHKYKVRNLFRWIWQQLSARKTEVQTT